MTLVVPAASEPSKPMAVDLGLADRVEQDLAKAGEAMVSLDRDAAERALGDAEALLLAHPELPQAAWLLAEVDRAWAARWARIDPKDDARAQKARAEAAGLDGGRAAGAVERAPASEPAAVSATLALERSTPGTSLWLDGVEAAAGAIAKSAGRHQLVVTLDGAPISAAWIDVQAGATIRVSGGGASPCSAADFHGVALSPARDTATAPGVDCPAWVAAAPTTDARQIRVARCNGSTCGPLLEWFWQPLPAWVAHPGGPPPGEHHGLAWPKWATWTAIGVAGAAAVTLGVLALAGAFASAPVETRFTSGGVKVQGLAFGF